MKAKTGAQIFAVVFGVIFFTTIGMVLYNANVDDEEDKIHDDIMMPFIVVTAIMVGIIIILIFLGIVTIGVVGREIRREGGQGNYASRRPGSG
jgi:hypothetical protein